MSMKLEAFKSNTRKDYGRVDDGTYPARVVQVVLLGKHKATDWQTGKQRFYDDGNPVIQNLVMFTFEFPTETIEIDGEDKPRWYSKEYNASTNEMSSLMAVLKALDEDKSLDLSNTVGKPCLVTIGSTSNDKPKVTGVTKVPKGMEVGELVNESRVFDPYDPDMEVWEKLPNFIRVKIKEAEDFDNMKLKKLLDVERAQEDNPDDELPF
jgi:hypothetical protein